MSICPCCGQALPEEIDPVAEMIAWCRSNGHPIYPGDRVSEATAAEILGRSPHTLRNWRSIGTGPPPVRVRGRVTYRLHDLVAEIEK